MGPDGSSCHGGTTLTDQSLTQSLLAAIESIPILDSHSHIDPLCPTARGLDDLLGYHYYTELAHSAGMDQASLAANVDSRERCRAILKFSERFDTTVQHGWLVEIARTYLGFAGERLTADDVNALFDKAAKVFAQPDWEQQVWKKTKLERVFLTNAFDDFLEGFDTKRYVPCLRTDDIVFHLGQVSVRERLATATGIVVGDMLTQRSALRRIFARFAGMGAAACAISLSPDFVPQPSI